jgi:hypothetical protein
MNEVILNEEELVIFLAWLWDTEPLFTKWCQGKVSEKEIIEEFKKR